MRVVEVTRRELAFDIDAAGSWLRLLDEELDATAAGTTIFIAWFVSPRGGPHAHRRVPRHTFHRLQGAPFVTVCVLDGVLPPLASRVALAFDSMLALPGCMLDLGAAFREMSGVLPGRARNRTRLDDAGLEQLGLGQQAESRAAAADLLDALHDAAASAKPAGIRLLREATRATHGGCDLSRLAASLVA